MTKQNFREILGEWSLIFLALSVGSAFLVITYTFIRALFFGVYIP